MASQFLLQHLSEFISISSNKRGGSQESNFLFILIGLLFMILLKGLIVYYAYNCVVPKVIYSLSENKTLETIESNFKPLSYSESLLLVILTVTLFNM
jgi:di/tricarboxylate transporter